MAGFHPNQLFGKMKSRDLTPSGREAQWYFDLLCTVYCEVASAYPAQHRTEFERDLASLRRRFEHEGLSFLTKTLPSLGKAIDTALASGSTLQVPAFKKRKGSHLPICFGWLLEYLFGSNGVERADACPIALRHIRQLTLGFYKLELPYSDESVNSTLTNFVITDSKLQQNWNLTNEDKHKLRRAESLVARLLGGVDPSRIYPRHGPGAVATRESGPGKSMFNRLYRTLEEVYPFTDYFFFSLSHVCDRVSRFRLRGPGQRNLGVEIPRASLFGPSSCRLNRRPNGLRVAALQWRDNPTPMDARVRLQQCSSYLCPRQIPKIRPGFILERNLVDVELHVETHGIARVVLVPKDSRGPRLISMEPLGIQWIQQGQMKLLVDTLEGDSLTRGQINFSNQEVNRSLALEASRHGNLVTLDMKDASDRVSRHLVWTLFPVNWIKALEASRSPETVLPSGETVKLNKFAPMGSAVCFPIEALCFWALAVSCLIAKYPNSPICESTKAVWVYGDDIIVYRKDYADIMQFLEKVGLLFNRHKCCTSGFFRESCGLDAYRGIVVTPVRFAKRWCHHSVVPTTLVSWIAYSNALWERGYHKSAEHIEECVQALTRVPYTTVPSGGLGFVRPTSDIIMANRRRGVKLRFNSKLHRLEAFGWIIRAKEFKSEERDWEELLQATSQSRSLGSDPCPRMPTSHSWAGLRYEDSLREWALKEKSKGSKTVMKDGLYSLPRRVTSKRGWFVVTL